MIRRATPADAKALSTLLRTYFTQTFRHLCDPGDLEAFLDEAYSPAALRAKLGGPRRATWLLFNDPSDEAPASSAPQTPIGYATTYPVHLPHPEVAPGDGGIQRLYILREHQGDGHEMALLTATLEWLKHDGPRTLWIDVWSENYRAQRFYTRHEFEVVGDYSFMVGDHADYELITRRPAHLPGE